MFQATSSAVNGPPLCQSMSAMVNVQVLRSGEASHFEASEGRVTLSTPVRVR